MTVKPKNRPGWHVKIALDITTVLRCDVQQWVQTTRYRQSVMIISNGWRMPSSAEPVEGLSQLQETKANGREFIIPVSNGLRKNEYLKTSVRTDNRPTKSPALSG